MTDLALHFEVAALIVYVGVREVLLYLRGRRSPPLEPNPHAGRVASGELAASYWQEHLRRLEDGQKAILEALQQLDQVLRDRLPPR